MIGRRVPRRTIVLLPLLGGELVVQTLHSLLPAVFVGRRSVEEGATDLLASRFHGRLGYAWWFERGKIATLWTHLRSLNLAERYPPTAELAQAYSEHAPAMMLIPWHRRGVRYAQRSHAIRVQLGDRWGQGQSLHFWGAGLYAASDVRGLARADARGAGAARADGRPVGAEQLPSPDRDGAVPARRPGRSRGGRQGGAGGGARHRRCPGPRDRARGVGEGHRRTRPRTDDPRRARTLERGRPHDRERHAGGRGAAPGRRRAVGGRRGVRGEPASLPASRDEERGGQSGQAVAPHRPAPRRRGHAAGDRRRRRSFGARAPSPGRRVGARASTGTTCRTSCASARASPPSRGRRRRARALFARSIEVATAQGARAETLRTRISRGRGRRGRSADGWTDGGGRSPCRGRAPRAHLGARGRTSTLEGISTDAEQVRSSRIGDPAYTLEIPSRDLHGIFPDRTFRTSARGVSSSQRRPRLLRPRPRPQMCGVGGCRGTHPLPGPSDPHSPASLPIPATASTSVRTARSSTPSRLQVGSA